MGKKQKKVKPADKCLKRISISVIVLLITLAVAVFCNNRMVANIMTLLSCAAVIAILVNILTIYNFMCIQQLVESGQSDKVSKKDLELYYNSIKER